MNAKNLAVLGTVAVVLGVAAYFSTSGRKIGSQSLNGKSVLKAFDIADVESVEIKGGKNLVVSAGEKGWTIASMFGYPADSGKIRENLMKLADLKVGQVASGVKLDSPAIVTLKGAKGAEIASLPLGGEHMRKSPGQGGMPGGGYPDGRYVGFGDKVVLVKDTLDAFDGDPKKWCNTRIASVPSSDVREVTFASGGKTAKLVRKDSSWTLEGLGADEEFDSSKAYSLDSALSYLDFDSVADPAKADTFGFATGAVYTATLKNGETYVAKVGDASGSQRYLQLSASFKPVGTNATENAASEKKVAEFNSTVGKWTYLVASYSAESLSKKRSDFVKEKKKEEPKKDDAAAAKKPAEKKPAAK